jgi:uncharacterized Tic20 family protein
MAELSGLALFLAVIAAMVIMFMVLMIIITAFYVIAACLRYKEDYRYRLSVRRSQIASQPPISQTKSVYR